MKEYTELFINNFIENKSPMEQFEIYPILSFGQEINNVVFYLFLAGQINISISILGISKGNQVPNAYVITHESLFRTIQQMIDNFIGRSKIIYLPLIYTIFHLILFTNLLGLVPYSSTSTVEQVITLALAFTLLIGILIQGFLTHKLYLLAAFIPSGTPFLLLFLMVPLEILAYITRTVSLGLRQAVNMITGHIQVKVGIGFIWVAYLNGTSILILSQPLFLQTLFQAQELLIAYQQAYIFTFITCITFKDMI